MSRLFAIWNRDETPVDPEILRKGRRALEMGGSARASVWLHDDAALVHSTWGAEPLPSGPSSTIAQASGDLFVVADARIDNSETLLRQLGLASSREPNGPNQTRSLIAAAYREWGVGCVEKLRGDFAIVLWDRRRGRLLLARDPFGVKPLHVHVCDRFVCVASEARMVLSHPRVPGAVDPVFLGACLLDLYSDPEASPYRAVRRVAPGQLIEVDRRDSRPRRFWNPDAVAPINLRSDQEHAERFRELFDRAVAARCLNSRGLVGLELSGGLDSTSVAASCAPAASSGNAPRVVGYSALFPRRSPGDEREYVELLARQAGVEIVTFDAAGASLVDRDGSGSVDLESPFVGWSVERRIMEALSEIGGRVLLTGHGGDSVCFGSPLVYADLLRQGKVLRLLEDLREHASRRGVGVWPLAKRYLLKTLLPEGWLESHRRLGRGGGGGVPNWMSRDFARRWGLELRLELERSRRYGGRSAREDSISNAECLGTVGEALYWLDRLGARHGIEVRHPFLDLDLVEFLLAVEPEQNFRAGWGKRLLRQAMVGRLPEAIRLRFDKAATGYFWRDRLRGPASAEIESILSRSALRGLGVLDEPAFARELREFRAGRKSSLDGPLWRLLCVELWLRGQTAEA